MCIGGSLVRLNKGSIIEKMKNQNIKTQTELAEKIDISKSQLSFMFSDEYEPLKKNVIKLADVLKVSPNDIILDEEDQMPINSDFNRYDYKLDEFIYVSNVRKNKDYNVFETFAGAGGLALGLESAGLSTYGAVEIDKNAAETLRINRPKWKVIENDIEFIADNLDEFIDEEIDILSGGYPCQTFSYAGKRNGFADTRGTLFYPYSKILSKLKPKAFIAENVRGLVNHDDGKTLEVMLKVFIKEGYEVYWNILNSWNYDVAQKRERIVIIGIREDLVKEQKYPFRFPLAQVYKPVLKDVLKDVPKSKVTAYSDKKREVMKLVPPGGCWVDLPEQIAKDYMGKSWYSGGGKRGMARRISWDEPCLTLTTSPSQKQTERCHPDETRPFSIREYARIQSFPDEWEFSGGVGAQYRQIGNAVPVNLAKYIGKSLVHYLNQFN